MFEQIHHKRVYEEVIAILLDRIGSGSLAIGEKLPPERQLADVMGISRTSVREALRSLETMGYIRSEVGGGTYVNAVTLSHVLSPLAVMMSQDMRFARDLLDMRQLLEVNMTSLAAQLSTKEQIASIYGAILNMEAEIERGGIGVDGDDQFHMEIAKASGNKAFITFTEFFSSLLTENKKATLGLEGQPSKSVDDHRVIFEAIRDKDAPRAARAMDEHLTKACRNIGTIWASDNARKPL
ncbi:MAG: HTH-type transcriptional regulator LutR [Desulfovibrio sp.]